MATPPTEFEYSSWRHGGWYVHTVRYPSGACGCVSRNYDDRKWRIACDPRPFEERPTFKTRDEAALAEWHLANAGAPYVIRFTDPQGVVTYMPENFGHGVHEHANAIEQAERFDDAGKAERRMNGYVNPGAFWNSEREHAERMREKFRNWK